MTTDTEIQITKLSPKPGDVLLVTHPDYISDHQRCLIFNAIESIRNDEPNLKDVSFIMLPQSIGFAEMDLPELRHLRDRINEAIYDKERQQ